MELHNYGQKQAFTLAGATHVALPKDNRKVAFTKPSRGMSEAKGELQATETLSFRCCSERYRFMRGAAFTLAEVLITLGIIGVVAAVVMPTLISKIQDRQNIAKWKREYSLISNAFQSAVNDGNQVCISYLSSGGCQCTLPGYKFIREDFIEAFKQKLKIVDYCTDGGEKMCAYYNDEAHKHGKYSWSGFLSTASRYKALGGSTTINSYNFNRYAFLLNDGAVVYFGGLHGGPWMVVDVNNANHGPNEFGRDVFVMKIYSNNLTNQHKIMPMGAEGTYNKAANGETCECSKDKGAKTGAYIAGESGAGEVISGACCSAYYLYTK